MKTEIHTQQIEMTTYPQWKKRLGAVLGVVLGVVPLLTLALILLGTGASAFSAMEQKPPSPSPSASTDTQNSDTKGSGAAKEPDCVPSSAIAEGESPSARSKPALPEKRSRKAAELPAAGEPGKTGAQTDAKPADSAEIVEAGKLVASLSKTQGDKLLAFLNEENAEALTAISGIGVTRARDIVEARPFEAIEDLRRVKGVGPRTLALVVNHGKSRANDEGSGKLTMPPTTATVLPAKPSSTEKPASASDKKPTAAAPRSGGS